MNALARFVHALVAGGPSAAALVLPDLSHAEAAAVEELGPLLEPARLAALMERQGPTYAWLSLPPLAPAHQPACK